MFDALWCSVLGRGLARATQLSPRAARTIWCCCCHLVACADSRSGWHAIVSHNIDHIAYTANIQGKRHSSVHTMLLYFNHTLSWAICVSLSLSIFSLAAWLTNCRTCGCEWQMWRCFGLHLYDCEQHRISDGRSSMALKESTYTVQNNTETECRHCSTVPSSLTGPRHPASPLKLASECARRRCASFAEKHSHSPTDLLTHSLACNTIGKRLRGMIVLWIDNNTSSFVTPLNISRRT